MKNINILQNLKSDIPASLVVFFVAIPLCLGIALASGAPLFSGIIAGIIGGIIVGLISGSQVGVSGPAAGLAAIVLTAISSLGGFENFLLAVVLGGMIQLILGVFKAGGIAQFFPSSVIKGMLTGIGIIIFIKQIPYFFGFEPNSGNENFFNGINSGVTLIGVISLCILILWEIVLTKKAKIFQLIQGPLVAVLVGIIFTFYTSGNTKWEILSKNLVNVPESSDFTSFINNFTLPNFTEISNPDIWIVAFTIALVASLETLLCLEATDKLDPEKRITPTNRELVAQGIGNIMSGLIGGLPVTQVIVRSSANIQSGGKTKKSAIIHGFLLLISVITIPAFLNKIPLSTLAAILFIVGYKLAKPSLFKSMFKLGWKQFTPFLITVLGIVFTDLLVGISIGFILALFIILKENFNNSHSIEISKDSSENKFTKIIFAEEVTFLNKNNIFKELQKLSDKSKIIIDIRQTKYLDNDIIDILNSFLSSVVEKQISVKIISINGEFENPSSMSRLE